MDLIIKSIGQFIIAMSGIFDVVFDGGIEKKRFHFNRYCSVCM